MSTLNPLSYINLSTLHIDPMNVRQHRSEVSPEMLATIRANGIIQPLQVRKNSDGYAVFAGGDRLRCLQALAKEGAIKPDEQIKCEIHNVTDAEARERSLVENFARSDMHPVDEFRAFTEMHTDKTQPIDIDALAARFGLDRVRVEQRVALGALSDKILDAWLADEIDEKTAQAFTLCPSKKAQVAIFDKLAKRGNIGASDVRHELKAGHDNPGRFLGFIGVEAYEARGGKVTRDLFGSNHVVSDAKLVSAMLIEKIDETCKKLVADGWAWAIAAPKDRHSYGQLEGKAKIPAELKAKLDKAEADFQRLYDAEENDWTAEQKAEQIVRAIEAEIEPLSYTAEQKAKAGVFVTVDEQDGTVDFDYGRVKPSEKKAVAVAERGSPSKAKPTGPKPSMAKDVSNALSSRLEDQLVAATKKALAADTLPKGAATILQEIVARQISRNMPDAVSKSLEALRDALTPKVVNEAIRKEFDRADYFGNAPIPVLLTAITETVGAGQAKKFKGKKKIDVAKFAAANVGKTPWLPVELRTANYDGPGASKRKAK